MKMSIMKIVGMSGYVRVRQGTSGYVGYVICVILLLANILLHSVGMACLQGFCFSRNTRNVTLGSRHPGGKKKPACLKIFRQNSWGKDFIKIRKKPEIHKIKLLRNSEKSIIIYLFQHF